MTFTVWRSPLRSPWLTSVLGVVLLVLFALVIVTGFLSHAAYMPDLPHNAIVPAGRDLPLTFGWPTSPSWLYALTQGVHTNAGLVAIPFLLAKLWSVIPKLFEYPPVKGLGHAVERLSVALLVSSAGFQLATGVVNAQYWYPFKFNFVVAHYYGAIVFTAALVLHVIVKVPAMRRARATRAELPTAQLTLSRRGLFAFTTAGALTLLAANAGQSLGGPFRRLALFAPRREAFPVNKTARAAGVTAAMVGPSYRLALRGIDATSLSREQLLALPQRTARLPIACVEGWTTTQEWTGVSLALLAEHAGAPGARELHVESLQPRGVLRQASLSGAQIAAGLLALRVNGEDLPLDHGFPARIVVPALPGVHNTKWVSALTFRS
ncbi:MAG TPA: molybdopterin-dependent oxidoreductase [Solirubrobacter sp.]|nr:molybdopterin-dependent oxidoreductase [Solirubrobacter sp.]